MIDPSFLGVPPTGLVEKSRQHVENIMYFGSSHYDTYQMLDGVSHYSGSIDYTQVCIQ